MVVRDVYPPRLVTVVRERCSAGRVRNGGCGVGKSSGCGCAGSFRVLCFFGGLGKSLGVFVAGVSRGSMCPLCAWYHSRMVATLREAGTEMGGGFVLVSEAWAVARIGSTVVCLFRGAFSICGGGWWLGVGVLVEAECVVGLVVPAVPFGVTVTCWGGGSVSLTRCGLLRYRFWSPLLDEGA